MENLHFAGKRMSIPTRVITTVETGRRAAKYVVKEIVDPNSESNERFTKWKGYKVLGYVALAESGACAVLAHVTWGTPTSAGFELFSYVTKKLAEEMRGDGNGDFFSALMALQRDGLPFVKRLSQAPWTVVPCLRRQSSQIGIRGA